MSEEIYRTASETHDWTTLVGEVADYLGAESGLVGITDFDSGRAEPSIHAHGLDDDPLFNIWIDEFGFENPWTDGVPPLTQGQIVTGAEILPLNDFRGLPLYSDVFSTLEIEDTLVAALSTEGARVLFLAVYCDRAHGPFTQTDRDRLQPLVPHLVRAASLETMLLDSGIREHVNRAALDEIEFAIFSISALEARPLNHRAEALLATGDGLVSRSGRLRATDHDSNKALQKHLFASGAGLTQPSVTTAAPFPLRRSAERLPLTCWAMPTSIRSETGLARLVSPGGGSRCGRHRGWRNTSRIRRTPEPQAEHGAMDPQAGAVKAWRTTPTRCRAHRDARRARARRMIHSTIDPTVGTS